MTTVHDDEAFARLAVDEARKCQVSPGEVTPFVGAVAVRNGRLLGAAHRGECRAGEHAEFTLLERKLSETPLAGTTVYTTLEPCTHRNPPKIPCVQRLIDRRVARVVIGTLDRNRTIQGDGYVELRKAGIEVEFFPAALVAELEELNRDFFRAHDRTYRRHHIHARRRERAIGTGEQIFLDWDGEMLHHYPTENILWWRPGLDGERVFVPQAVLAFGEPDLCDSQINISYQREPRVFADLVTEALGYYEKRSDPFFNGELAGLRVWDPSSPKLQFQLVRFFDFVQTNLAVDYPRQPLPTLRERSILSGRLRSFESSPLANATGINGLSFSNDGFMIFQVRNKKVAMRKNEACSAFSGFVDAKDVADAMSGTSEPTLSRLDTLRELVEEIGIDRSDIVEQRFLGITRELHRGGMPELFYAIRIDLPKKDILRRHRRDNEGEKYAIEFGEFATPSPGAAADRSSEPPPLRQLIEKIERSKGARVSIPLMTNLVLWLKGWDTTRVGAGPIDLPRTSDMVSGAV